MKKTYIIPVSLTVELGGRDALLTTLSGGEVGTSGGNTSDGGINDADVKESKSLWGTEW